MSFVVLQTEKALQLYPGVVYEFDLIGGYGYAVLIRKYAGGERGSRLAYQGHLLLVLPGLYQERPQRLERMFHPLLMGSSGLWFMMFFPVELGLKRGLFRAMGIVKNIRKWPVPRLPEQKDARKVPWYWGSREREWEYMPVDKDKFDVYRVSTIAIIRMLKGLSLRFVEKAKRKRKFGASKNTLV